MVSKILERQYLYIRDLTEDEQAKIDAAKSITPMQACPDIGELDSGEQVEIIHAYNTGDGLNLGFNCADGRYSTAHLSQVLLKNPKFQWQYIADRNDKR